MLRIDAHEMCIRDRKEYTRQIYDTNAFLSTGSCLKDSSVIYIKIKKENPCVKGNLMDNPVTFSDITLLNTLATCANMTLSLIHI